VNLETTEEVGTMADGVEYVYWTFGGTVPGSFIRVKQGDEIEFHLSNHPSSKMPHNIDLHAVTGPGGRATSSLTAPGHTTTVPVPGRGASEPCSGQGDDPNRPRKRRRRGFAVHRGATEPEGIHVADGMCSRIMVGPKDSWPPVVREHYAMQGDC